MTRKIDILLQVIAAWKRKDLDAVLACMDENIVWHFAAAAEPPVRGRAQARRFLERFGADIHDIRWRIFDHAEVGNRLFVEGVDEFVTGAGVTISAPYAGVLDFHGDLIVGWRDYVDVGVMGRQRAGEARSDQVNQLIDRTAIA